MSTSSIRPETAPFLDIDILKKEEKDPNKTKKEIYKLILSRCHERIKKVNRTTEHRECFFEIPFFMPGYPVYDIDAANKYLVKHLNLNGLYAESVSEGKIYISWQPRDVNYEQFQYRAEKATQATNIYKLSISPFAKKSKKNQKSPDSIFNRKIPVIELDDPDELDAKGYPKQVQHQAYFATPFVSNPSMMSSSSPHQIYQTGAYQQSPSVPYYPPPPPTNQIQPTAGGYAKPPVYRSISIPSVQRQPGQPATRQAPPSAQMWGFAAPPSQVYATTTRQKSHPGIPRYIAPQPQYPQYPQQRPPPSPPISLPPSPPISPPPSPPIQSMIPLNYQFTPSSTPPPSEFDLRSEIRSEHSSTRRMPPPQAHKLRPSNRSQTQIRTRTRTRIQHQPRRPRDRRVPEYQENRSNFDLIDVPTHKSKGKGKSKKKKDQDKPSNVSMLQYAGHLGDMIPVNTKKVEKNYPDKRHKSWRPGIEDAHKFPRPPPFRPAQWS